MNNKKKRQGLWILLLCLTAFAVIFFLFPDTSKFIGRIILPAEEYADGDLTLHVIDVGQGQALLLESDDHFAVIDGGGRESSSLFIACLKNAGVEKLDYLIATHYDEDHLAGLIGALHVFEVDKVLGPDYRADTEIYVSFEKTLSDHSFEITCPEPGDSFSLGSATLTLVGPISYDHEEENDNSLCFRVSCGKTHFLMTGDATANAEKEMLENNTALYSDLLVVGHHGSAYSTSEEFLSKVRPSIAVISVGKDNDYGHPTSAVLERLEEIGAMIFRTDEMGSLVFETDGNHITVRNE